MTNFSVNSRRRAKNPEMVARTWTFVGSTACWHKLCQKGTTGSRGGVI